ncbi:MAG: ABC transporter permease [Chlorobi bacterium]|nr:ABC transporter permease [Chlorobiota bacterium]
MLKILKYAFFDLIRSRWSYTYFLFYFIITFSLLYLSADLSKVIISLMNIILVLSPLIASIFGVIYYYNSREFTELLLAQPIKRSNIFIGQYLGLVFSLTVSLLLGLLIPFAIYGIFYNSEIWNFVILIIAGVFLTFIFAGFSYNIALHNENKIKGFGFAILIWLLLAVAYDGIFLLALVTFSDYPLEKFALFATALNPIDLSRILILLKLDISALMGYTGAVFNNFFGAAKGMIISGLSLFFWTIIPLAMIIRKSSKKDF